MKHLVLAIVVALAASLPAQKFIKGAPPRPGAPVLTEAEKEAQKAATRQHIMERTGGIVEKLGTGKVVVVNCQSKIPAEDVAAKVEQFGKFLHVNIQQLPGTWKLGTPIPEGSNVALFIVDDSTLPISLIAPEAQWGVLNVARLDKGPRFSKAFSRAAVLTFGAGVSQYKASPLQTVTCPEDLDKLLSDGLAFDGLSAMTRNLEKLGVTPTKRTSYRKACMDGWAPAPTNDFQKAVWEEVHAKPTKPMTIKFDPKKGE